MEWRRVGRLSDLLSFAGGVAIEREQTDREYSKQIPDALLQQFKAYADASRPESYAICFLVDGRAVAVLSQGTGPGYSEVTPDPRWAAESFFFVGDTK